MKTTLGLDLGTNSIGWALRNPDFTENQIEKVGVLTFNKGVGIDKTGEYSYAAQRTAKRSTRRLYQARKYRLWATLETLIEQKYCPLSIENLNKWRKYDKIEARKNNNGGRVYPIDDLNFDAWIKLDFDGNGKPNYTSPYQLRRELAETKLDFLQEENKYKLGRALYHIAQRRGFKSSRKSIDNNSENDTNDSVEIDLAASEIKLNKDIQQLFNKYPSAKTIGWLFALLENDGIRIREDISQYAIRENYKDEIKQIFEFQGFTTNDTLYTKLVETGKNKNDGYIFYKRPLRSQKGLIGKCTLEPNKFRVPISHPSFEIFRAWSFLNNIKYKPLGDNDATWKELPLDLKQKIYQDKFFRFKPDFPFSEIEDFIKKEGKNWIFNYKSRSTVSGCPLSGRLKRIFGDDFLNIQISKIASEKAQKNFYDIEDIWHVFFNFEDQEFVEDFARKKLKLDDGQTKQFVSAWNATPVGYAMLSLNAINKINEFLLKGLIYTEAVLLANIPAIIGNDLWLKNEAYILNEITDVIDKNRIQKTILNIVNSLISDHKNLASHEQFGVKDSIYNLVQSDLDDIQKAIDEQFGAKTWQEKREEEKDSIFIAVKDCYKAYFVPTGLERKYINDERHFVIHSNEINYYKTDGGYYRLPKLIDTLGEFLQLNFNTSDEKLLKIYHPSEINIYPHATPDKNGELKLGSPKTGSFKNPMAMRTLHELRKLMNFMIETKQVDSETRIVVEVARELNDANKRWAIETWQKQREAENQEFAMAIEGLIENEKDVIANSKNDDDIDKVRLWYEQNEEDPTPPVASNKKEIKGIKWTDNKKDSYKAIAAKKDLIDKYRLWQEQDYMCIYTGVVIKITDLFKENVIDFEHTIPRSISFDNSLANLTVCYANFNRTVKKNQIPANLNNYEAILPRIAKWQEKVERIKQQIDFWKTKSKRAAVKEDKDAAIRQKHLWQMDLDYWKNKVDRFTMKEVTSGFKNSQKVDTQLISKYAFHYLKTYFDKVDVQKGSITAEFRKIYGLQIPDVKKDRSKHSHHAKDAAVLTLIPTAHKRDEILQQYYEHLERKQSFKIEPYKGFKREFVWNIDDSILIKNITNNQALTSASRLVRKRGKVQFIEGTNTPKIATGDCIRGQLHLESFYGAIKPAKRNEKDEILRDENKKIIQEETLKYAKRELLLFAKDTNAIGFSSLEELGKKMVDMPLFKQIENQVNQIYNGSLRDALDPISGGVYMFDRKGNKVNKIRHIRCWATTITNPLSIKKQTYPSKLDYKNQYWAANGENTFCAFYEYISKGKKDNIKKDRELEVINLKESADLITFGLIDSDRKLEIYRRHKNGDVIIRSNGQKERPIALLQEGVKVLFYENTIEELKKNDTENNDDYNKRLSIRLYKIVKFAAGQITFLHHLNAKDDKQLMEEYPEKSFFKIDKNGQRVEFGKRGKNGFTEAISEIDKLNTGKPFPKLLYSKEWLNMAIEGIHFDLKMDGKVVFTL